MVFLEESGREMIVAEEKTWLCITSFKNAEIWNNYGGKDSDIYMK